MTITKTGRGFRYGNRRLGDLKMQTQKEGDKKTAKEGKERIYVRKGGIWREKVLLQSTALMKSPGDIRE